MNKIHLFIKALSIFYLLKKLGQVVGKVRKINMEANMLINMKMILSDVRELLGCEPFSYTGS